MNHITYISMNYARLEKGARYRLTDRAPVFSWAAEAQHTQAVQTAYSLQVHAEGTLLWDTGWVETPKQECCYTGEALPVDRPLTVTVRVRDDRGEEGEPASETFYAADPAFVAPPWVAAAEDVPGRAVYFRRNFFLSGDVRRATLYVCGLGYHTVYMNGDEADTAVLDPLHADYTASCYFTVLPGMERFLDEGENCLGIVVGEGWRRAMGVCTVDPNLSNVHFFGTPQLSAALRVTYADGRTETIETGADWLWSHGPIVENDLFNGETYDAAQTVANWNRCDCTHTFSPVALADAPGGVTRINTLEPIRAQESFAPRSITPLGEGRYLVDFGVNIAGVCRLTLPRTMTAGQRITLVHAEMLQEDGSVYTAPNRSAAQTETYVASGDSRDLYIWQPQFTYHGFRYVEVTGYPFLSREDIRAVALYTDVASGSSFTCGDPRVNAIQAAIVRTEKNNIHGLLTDCPQRDERMGWLNDATVRFEETPYNFRVGRLFPKVIRDILDAQEADGSICCTAPHVFGSRPADPVCSSFLVAALQALLHAGNGAAIREGYEGFAAWQRCLAEHSEGDIVTYSYYGDWAGPDYACMMPGWPFSKVTPGDLMSTGFYYLNARLLARFAAMLGKAEDEEKYTADAERIRAAMLARFFNAETGQIATGSQACQAFALWLGILPEEKRALVAEFLHNKLVEEEYRLTTGNLCTRYLYDVLTEYGYLEDAWTLITQDAYPSLGFMLQNEATTIWERFELKKDPAMNSHDHPMYGAVGYWFYAYLAGIKPTAPGYERVSIHPYFPEGLLSVNATVDTPKGDLTVRWVRRFGKRTLHVTVPFGVEATVIFAGEEKTVGSGFWRFEVPESAE